MKGINMNKSIEELGEERNRIIGFDPENEELCLVAVRQYGCALQYVKDQTPELCLEAVRQNGNALQYVKDLSMLV